MRRSLAALLIACTFAACGEAAESGGGAGDTPGPAAARDATAIRPSTMAAATVEAQAAAEERSTGSAAADDRSGDEPGIAPAAASDRPKRGIVVRLVRSQFGPIVGDGRGQAFYLFDHERDSRPRCYGACARAWPPVYARGRPVAGRRTDPDLLGTTRRADGRRQLTYRGQPMYYYVRDEPGVVLCQNVFEYGGLWLVVQRDGQALT